MRPVSFPVVACVHWDAWSNTNTVGPLIEGEDRKEAWSEGQIQTLAIDEFAKALSALDTVMIAHPDSKGWIDFKLRLIPRTER